MRLILNATHTNDVRAALALRAWAAKAFGCTFGCVLAEQFVVRNDMSQYVRGKEHERILHYQRERLEGELKRLRTVGGGGLLIDGDMILRNVEDGHPADSPQHLAAHRVYAKDLAAMEPTCLRGGYGLVKRDIYAQEKVPGRIPHTAVAFDKGAANVVADDTHVVGELYLPMMTNERSGNVEGTMPATYQESWMLDTVGRAKRVAGSVAWRGQAGDTTGGGFRGGVGGRTVALVNPRYVGGSISFGPLLERDVARVAKVAAMCDELALWLHIGAGQLSGDEARRYVETWAKVA